MYVDTSMYICIRVNRWEMGELLFEAFIKYPCMPYYILLHMYIYTVRIYIICYMYSSDIQKVFFVADNAATFMHNLTILCHGTWHMYMDVCRHAHVHGRV